MRTAAKVAEDYINVWNEADPARRRALLESTWTPNATYFDPVAMGKGFDAIEKIIGTVHERFPGFSFALSGNADGHGNVVRFSWALGPKGGAAVVKGTDFVERDFDKICAVTGFLDLVPAATSSAMRSS
jgi:SnoaL-like domain